MRLSHEVTMSLIKEAQEGSKSAFEKLVDSNVALIHSIANRFRNRGMDYEDIFQTGCIGLIKAIERFNFTMGVRFSTYAVPVIMGEIRRCLRDDGLIKVSRTIKDKARDVLRMQEKIKIETGMEPTTNELSLRLNMDSAEIAFVLEALVHPSSLDEPLLANSNLHPLDMVRGKQNDESNINRLMLKQAMIKLQPRERKLIYLRYFKDKTQVETAGELGVSQVQVSRLESKILSKLKTMIS